MSANSCGSIKDLAVWMCGHLLWTKTQRVEANSNSVCNVCLDLTLHALLTEGKHSPDQMYLSMNVDT